MHNQTRARRAGPAKGGEGLHCFALSLSALASQTACCISSSQRILEALSVSWEDGQRIKKEQCMRMKQN